MRPAPTQPARPGRPCFLVPSLPASLSFSPLVFPSCFAYPASHPCRSTRPPLCPVHLPYRLAPSEGSSGSVLVPPPNTHTLSLHTATLAHPPSLIVSFKDGYFLLSCCSRVGALGAGQPAPSAGLRRRASCWLWVRVSGRVRGRHGIEGREGGIKWTSACTAGSHGTDEGGGSVAGIANGTPRGRWRADE